MGFSRATKKQSKMRLAILGPAGSGKSYTSLAVAAAIAAAVGTRVAAIDSERGSLSKYAGLFEFDVNELRQFGPPDYTAAIHDAIAARYGVLIIDSLSHAWMGKGGALEMVDHAAKRNRGGNKFSAWGDVTPLHNEMIDAITGAPMHVIVTMRTKMEYVQEKDERTGKTSIRKVGMQPVQRDGLEYEFDVVGDMDLENNFVITKSRCPELAGQVINKPGRDLADRLLAWLTDGAPAPLQAEAAPASPVAEADGRERRIAELLATRALPAGLKEKWFAKAGVSCWSDMSEDTFSKCLRFIEKQEPVA